jgi:hypothetical protein
MDKNLLVENGHRLIAALEKRGVALKAAVWVYYTDTETWRLWLVPQQAQDKREFYRQVAEAISENWDTLQGMHASDTELVPEKHPAITGLRAMVRMEGLGSLQMSSNMLNGFYLPDGIILKMAS